MTWVLVYGVLLATYLITWIAFPDGAHAPENVRKISGLIAIVVGLASALQKVSLRVYFFYRRIALRMNPDSTGKWWFSARFDTEIGPDEFATFIQGMKKNLPLLSIRLVGFDGTTAQIQVEETIILKVDFHSADMSIDGTSHVSLISNTLEVSYGRAKYKIDREISPLLEFFANELRPSNASFELDVQFLKENPFFAVYVANLKPENVHEYKVVLHVDANNYLKAKEKVEISKTKLHVTADNTRTFKELAKDFVLLSPDLRMMKTS